MIEESISAKLVFNTMTFFFSSAIVYLKLDVEVFMLFSLLLILDYITGMLKAHRLGHGITSNRMKYGVISKLSMVLIPIVLAIGAKAVGADFSSVLLVGINILILSEVYSIIGNIYTMNTGEELPEYDAVSMIGKRIRDFLLKFSEDDK